MLTPSTHFRANKLVVLTASSRSPLMQASSRQVAQRSEVFQPEWSQSWQASQPVFGDPPFWHWRLQDCDWAGLNREGQIRPREIN